MRACGHSTEMALLRTLNVSLVMTDGETNTLLVLLDLSAAFDTLRHTLLLQRLHAEIGLAGSVLDWFSSYLSCRSQQLLEGHALSVETPRLVCAGVPQGSVLDRCIFFFFSFLSFYFSSSSSSSSSSSFSFYVSLHQAFGRIH